MCWWNLDTLMYSEINKLLQQKNNASFPISMRLGWLHYVERIYHNWLPKKVFSAGIQEVKKTQIKEIIYL